MPEQQPRGQPRDAEAAVSAYAPLLREMMLGADGREEEVRRPTRVWWLFTSTKVRNPTYQQTRAASRRPTFPT